MTTLSATAKSLLNLHYAILGSQPTLAQLNTYAGEYNKARAAGATADAAMDAIATHILATDAAVNTLMPNLSSASTLATSILANVGITNAKIVEFITKALDGSLFGFAFPLNQAVRVISDYVANYKTGMAADASWDADLVAAQAVVAARPVPQAVGQSFTLTTSIDLLSGGAGADNFYGSSIDNNGTGTSINPGDNLAGGAGTDMLSLTLSGSTANPTIPLQTTGIEKISVGNYNSFAGADTISAAAASDITDLMVSGSGDTAFTGVRALAKVSLSSSTGATSVAYATSAVAGTADTQALSVSGAGTASSPVTFTVAGIETLAITSDGTASGISLAASNDHKTITVAGAAGLTILASGETTITTVDASASTGGVSVQDLGASKLTMTGGAGNDTLRIDGSTIDIDDSINAGEGTDKLIFTAATNVASATNGAKLVGFETVEGYRNTTLTTASNLVVAQDVSLLGSAIKTVGVSSWTVTDDTANNGAGFANADGVSFTNMAADTAMSIAGIKAAGDTANSDAVTLGFTASADLKTDTTTDAITVTLGSSTAAATSGNTGDTVTLNLSVDDYETVTLVSQGGTNTIADLASSDLKKLIINASKALTITDTTEPTTLRTIDASASTANVDVNAFAMDGASTLIGGAGNDEFQGSTAADSITGGAGNDSIDGAGGNDILDGGDGNDTITGGSGAETISGGAGEDVITGGTGNDSLDGGAGNDTFVINATDAATPVLDLSSADKLSGGDGTDTIRFDAALATARTIDLSDPAETRLSGVTGVEKITLNSSTSALTLKVGDIALGSFGGALTVDIGANNTLNHSMDASSVLNSATKLTFNGNSGVNNYTLGNAIDVVNLSSGNDSANVSNILFLQATDTVGGGTGSDTLTFAVATGAATLPVSVTAAQLAGVSGFETVLIDTNDVTPYVVAIDDAFVTANKDSATDTLTITRDATTDTGTLRISASAITAGKLAINGGSGADTIGGGTLADALNGGGGADSISGGDGNDTITGAAGIDTLTGGAGIDTFKVSDVTSADRNKVTDFTAGAGGDVFNLNSGVGLLSGTDNFASTAAIQAHASAGALTVVAATEVVRVTSAALSSNLFLTTANGDLDGTNLIAAIGGTITAAVPDGEYLFAVADQFGNVGIYRGDAGTGDTGIVAAELALVGVLQNVSLSSLVFGNFANAA